MWNEIMRVTFIDSNQIISIILVLKKQKRRMNVIVTQL